MKPIQLQEKRGQHGANRTLWVLEEPPAKQALVAGKPQAPLSLWRSAMQRRVKHPRLQFAKGVQIDVLA